MQKCTKYVSYLQLIYINITLWQHRNKVSVVFVNFSTHVFVSCWKSCQSTSYICTQHVHLHTFEHAKQLANDKSAIYLMHSWEEKIWFVAFLVVIHFLRKWCMVIKYLKNVVKMYCRIVFLQYLERFIFHKRTFLYETRNLILRYILISILISNLNKYNSKWYFAH